MKAVHITNIFSPDQIPLRIFALLCRMRGFENCGTKLIIQPKDVRKPVRRRELLNCYIKEIKLYLVISTITSSTKKFQQLYLNDASECLSSWTTSPQDGWGLQIWLRCLSVCAGVRTLSGFSTIRKGSQCQKSLLKPLFCFNFLSSIY